MKHNKIFAGLAVAGSLIAMSGAANAISPAAAIALSAMGGAAVGTAAANAAEPRVAVAPNATYVVGAGPTQVAGHFEVINGVNTWVPAGSTVTVTANGTVATNATVNYDHDGDGVLNHTDRFPNDGTRS